VRERREYVSRVMDPRTYGIPDGLLREPRTIRDSLINLRSGGVNLLGAETHLDFIPPSFAISLRFVFIDSQYPPMRAQSSKPGSPKSNGLWYEQKGGSGISLLLPSLRQLANLAGVQWEYFERYDDGRTALYWRFRGRARVRLFDGTWIHAEGTGESDLRDGSAEIAGMSSERAQGMRAKGSQRAESITKARIIRELLAIRQVYSWEEAERPFVWPALIYQPPTDDVEINRAIARRELGIVDQVYGRQVVDVTARPVAALPDHGERTVPDFQEEARKLAERERVVAEPVRRGGPPPSAAPPPAPPVPSRSFQEQADDEPPPWEDEAQIEPGEPTFQTPVPVKWNGTDYTLPEIRTYCASKKWPDPSTTTDEKRAQLVAWLRSAKGKAEIDAVLAAGPR